MEHPPGMLIQPGADLGMLVGGVVVEDELDHLARRHCAADRVEKADDLLMAVLLPAAAKDSAVVDVEGGEQGGGAIALLVVGHGAAFAGRQGQAWLGDRGPGSGFSRRSTARWHGPAGSYMGR